MTNTILVNKNNKIKDNYLKRVELITIKNIFNEEIQVEKNTLENFLKLQNFLLKKNIEIGIDSAYRSIEKQQEILDEYMQKYGEEYCNRYVALPGLSEHHTGLAIDFYIKVDGRFPSDDKEVLDKQLSKYKEIEKYFKDFGFILRYPENKEEVTGYNYEPWHIRYVGEFVANIIYNNNLTLEEYLNDFSGLIAINKPKDRTSFDVVNDIVHLFGIKRIGHTGTLDPLATGVLIVAIGKATKVVELVTSSYKEYIADMKLGIRTDTKDITGKVLEECLDIEIDNTDEIIKSFKKTYLQEVPIYSAVKVNGKKLYEYARNNIEVELPKKEVTIKEIEILEKNKDEIKIRTVVSKGTYIRSLIDDIGEALGCHATMKTLVRTKQANISINDAYTIEQIKNNNYKLLSIEDVLDYPVEIVDKELEKKIQNGVRIDNYLNIEDKVIFKNTDNKILGIYEKDNNELKVWKNFS